MIQNKYNKLKKLIKESIIQEHYLPEYEDMYDKAVGYINNFGLHDFFEDLINNDNLDHQYKIILSRIIDKIAL